MPEILSSAGIAARQSLLQSNQTLGTVVHAILLDRFGEEIYGWEPVTVALECKAEFGCDPSTTVMDKWCAIQVAMASDAFFRRIDAFLSICNTLSSGEPYADVFDPVTPEEAAWGIAEVSLNRDFLPFSPTIKSYVSTILRQDGFSEDEFPPVFSQVFDRTPSEHVVRENLAALGNSANIDSFMRDNIVDLLAQLNRLPDMQNIDLSTLQKGISHVLRLKP